MDFGREQLNKHGWKDGAGLGREETGIKEAIKVKIKNDTRGVGHDAGAEFTFHWWDHVFNKAASNIQVETTETGVALKKKETPSKASNKAKTYENKSMLYSQFVKGATLSDGNYQQEAMADAESDDEDEQTAQSCLVPSNEAEIFRVCGGRTAHKGARHGHKMDAKLLRIQKQEEEHLANQNPSFKQTSNGNHQQIGKSKPSTNHVDANEDSNSNSVNCESVLEPKRKKKKKKDKQKLEEREESVSVCEGLEHSPHNEVSTSKVENEICDANGHVIKPKKSKKRRKEKNEYVENLDETPLCDIVQVEEPLLKKSKKRRKEKNEYVENLDKTPLCDIVQVAEPLLKKSKKRPKDQIDKPKTKVEYSDENVICDGGTVEENVHGKERKKEKIRNKEKDECEGVERSKKKKKRKNRDMEH